jgi:hypothetical protein
MFQSLRNHCALFVSAEKIKAWLLCTAMILAGAPNLHAHAQCSDPYETNCVVTIGPMCGMIPCWVKYDLTVNDDTPNAQINYTVIENGYVIDMGTVSSGGHIVEVIQEEIPAPAIWGSMYATASGYSQSNTVSLSF